MKLFIKLLLIASLGVASLAASNTYMTPVDKLAVGHVLATDVVLGEFVIRGNEPHIRKTTWEAGTALGPTHIALLQSEHLVDPEADVSALEGNETPPAQRVASVTCYSEPGANAGATTDVNVGELQAGQVLGMDAEVLWRTEDNGDTFRHTRVVVPSGTVASDEVKARLASGLSEDLEEQLTEAEVDAGVIDDIRTGGISEALVPVLEEAGVTEKVIDQLKRGGVDHVRVNDFRFEQWQWKWWFLVGCAGMLVAAMLARKTAPKGGASEEAGYTYESSSEHMREMLAMLETAWNEAQLAPDSEQRCLVVVRHLDLVKAGPQFEVNEGLGAFKTRAGYAHYAKIVDSFAYGERQVHRAWAAAVDGVEDEAMLSLSRAIDTMRETVQHL